MNLRLALKKRIILQKYKHWYVLDEDFPWNVEKLYHTIQRHTDSSFNIPVIFCSIKEANKILHDLGEEEDEYLRFASGIYWRELGIIFIFKFDEYLPLIETLFHEQRHVMQDKDPDFRHHFESDKALPYKERITEKDAFHYAKKKAAEHIAHFMTPYLVSRAANK